MDKGIPVLFINKSDCCACGACENICSQKAITMQEDEYGFFYPVIDDSKCVGCSMCKSVCGFQNKKIENDPLEVYAAVAREKNIVEKSASGGIFTAIARAVLLDNGLIVGAALQEDYSVEHVIVEDEDGLEKLQGSKYTQSKINNVFSIVEKHLKKEEKVLFSGTPCQVAGLKSYLKKEYNNLITVDVICHGVPNNRMFQDYIRIIESKENGRISFFTFRDKSIGWGINASVIINGHKKKIWQSMSSYLYYFTKGWIYRDSCYGCGYACSHRLSDITLGDYWGIEKQHPEYLGKNGWDETKGISVVIVNTEKGVEYIKQVSSYIELKSSTFEKASEANGQLKYPSNPGKRNEILDVYIDGGWNALESRFIKQIGWRYYSSPIKNIIPKIIKRKLKALKGELKK